MKVLIIGGVAGGATAAARLRRLDESAQIVVIERTGYVSYANCGLPYYVGGVIQDRRRLTLQTPESFKSRFNIDVRVRQEAISIDREAKEVEVRRLDDGSIYVESYDKLVLSPGARPTIPPVPGVDLPGVFTLRTVEDAFAISDYIDANRVQSAIVVGGGFIGLETAENLIGRGVETTVLQRPAHALKVLDSDMAAYLHGAMRDGGIDLRTRADLTEISSDSGDSKLTVKYRNADTKDSMEPLSADMVVLAIGVSPDSHLASDAGLETGMKGSIRTDEHMRTSDPDIFAVGDAVEVVNKVTGKPALIALAGPANKQGRIAADNICGIESTYRGSQGSFILKMFDLTVASTGLNETGAQSAGIDYDSAVISMANHATYYPGAEQMTLKVVFENGTGKILGAQIAGYSGVDKRIDVLATAVGSGMTAADLTDLDLAYAPPYSSAKDPVNMIGYVIGNIVSGRVKQTHWDEVTTRISGSGTGGSDFMILDVRTTGEYDKGHFDGSVNIPLDELREHLDEIPHGKQLLVYCHSGLRSYIACRILSQNGFDCENVSGGFGFYQITELDQRLLREGRGPCGL
ncbi:MAG: FAD-dependent oxidoreductase [Coriobacteriales bacterium]|jgi:NADPH-dependent 2,4-dienoyl-CoA reductase/sulfur reductase-like enzyme/rhodanese-related sulfurtransferase